MSRPGCAPGRCALVLTDGWPPCQPRLGPMTEVQAQYEENLRTLRRARTQESRSRARAETAEMYMERIVLADSLKERARLMREYEGHKALYEPEQP